MRQAKGRQARRAVTKDSAWSEHLPEEEKQREISSVGSQGLTNDEGCSPAPSCFSLLGRGQAKIPCKGDHYNIAPLLFAFVKLEAV